jgi:N4-gp56 family major capsid protein
MLGIVLSPFLLKSASVHGSAEAGPGFAALVAAVRTVYSGEIYFSALPNLRFDQFATRKTELSAQPGDTISMPKAGTIKRGGTLTEGVRIQAKSMTLSSITMTVDEKGNAIGMTERLLQTSFYDQMAMASMLLGRDLAQVLDKDLRDVALTATTKVYANGKTTRNSLTAADKFTTTTVHAIVERLETNSSPKWMNDFYVCFAHPHQLSDIRLSAGWVNAALYQGAGPLMYGEVGRWGDMRFVSTSVMPNGASSALNDAGEYADLGYSSALDQLVTGALNTASVYQAVAFGEYSYGHAVALPVELRDNGVQDFGREHALAWYAIWGQGVLENSNLVIIETA